MSLRTTHAYPDRVEYENSVSGEKVAVSATRLFNPDTGFGLADATRAEFRAADALPSGVNEAASDKIYQR